jgi:uncharacterized protein (TIGR00369 family)
MSIFDQFQKPPCAELLGWTLLSADEETGAVRVEFQGRQSFLNAGGVIQGGLIAAMLDDTLGPTVLVKTAGRHYCATIDLRVSFLAPARPGVLIGEGRIIKLGATIGFLEGRLLTAAGELVATATASARIVPTTAIARTRAPGDAPGEHPLAMRT